MSEVLYRNAPNRILDAQLQAIDQELVKLSEVEIHTRDELAHHCINEYSLMLKDDVDSFTRSAILVAIVQKQMILGVDHELSLQYLEEASFLREHKSADVKCMMAEVLLMCGKDRNTAIRKHLKEATQLLRVDEVTKAEYDLLWTMTQYSQGQIDIAENSTNGREEIEALRSLYESLMMLRTVVYDRLDSTFLPQLCYLQGKGMIMGDRPKEGGQCFVDGLNIFREKFAHDKIQELTFLEGVGLVSSMSDRPQQKLFIKVARMSIERFLSINEFDLTETECVSHMKRIFTERSLIEFNTKGTSSSLLQFVFNDPDVLKFESIESVLENAIDLSNSDKELLFNQTIKLFENNRLQHRWNDHIEFMLLNQWLMISVVDKLDIFAKKDKLLSNYTPTHSVPQEVPKNETLCGVGILYLQTGMTIMLSKTAVNFGKRLADTGLYMLKRNHKVLPDTTIYWALTSYAIVLLRTGYKCQAYNCATLAVRMIYQRTPDAYNMLSRLTINLANIIEQLGLVQDYSKAVADARLFIDKTSLTKEKIILLEMEMRMHLLNNNKQDALAVAEKLINIQDPCILNNAALTMLILKNDAGAIEKLRQAETLSTNTSDKEIIRGNLNFATSWMNSDNRTLGYSTNQKQHAFPMLEEYRNSMESKEVPIFLPGDNDRWIESRMCFINRSEVTDEAVPEAPKPELLFGLRENKVLVMRDPNGKVFVRYIFPPESRAKAERYINRVQISISHPNILYGISAFMHRKGVIDIDAEYCDAWSLTKLIPRIPEEWRPIVAASVVRQVLQAIVYGAYVTRTRFRHICPRYIYVRRDGCVKLDLPDIMHMNSLRDEEAYFLENPYTAPECRHSMGSFKSDDYRSDLWSVGVLILAIMTGSTLQPPYRASRTPNELTDEEDMLDYQEDVVAFETLITTNDDNLWNMYIPNDYLRFLARRFLQIRCTSRGTIVSALAITYVLGGVSPANTQSVSSPPTESVLDLSGLSAERAKLVKLRNETRSTNYFSGGYTDPSPSNTGMSYVESPMLVIDGDRIPHPWSLDRTTAFDVPKKILIEQYKLVLDPTGPQYRFVLTDSLPERLYAIPQGPNTKAAFALGNPCANAAISFEKLIVAEYKSWRQARDVFGMKRIVDRIMYDIISKRSRNAWIGMESALKRAMNDERMELLLDDLSDV